MYLLIIVMCGVGYFLRLTTSPHIFLSFSQQLKRDSSSAFYVPAARLSECNRETRGETTHSSAGEDTKRKQVSCSPLPGNSYEDETEDEEVKMNCAGGIGEYISSSDESDSEESDDETDSESRSLHGRYEFV